MIGIALSAMPMAMLEEREFFIRKAIGWVLREAGKSDPRRVAAFVEPRIDRMSGVTIREAVKYLEQGLQTSILSRYRSRRQGGKSAPGGEISTGTT